MCLLGSIRVIFLSKSVVLENVSICLEVSSGDSYFNFLFGTQLSTRFHSTWFTSLAFYLCSAIVTAVLLGENLSVGKYIISSSPHLCLSIWLSRSFSIGSTVVCIVLCMIDSSSSSSPISIVNVFFSRTENEDCHSISKSTIIIFSCFLFLSLSLQKRN